MFLFSRFSKFANLFAPHSRLCPRIFMAVAVFCIAVSSVPTAHAQTLEMPAAPVLTSKHETLKVKWEAPVSASPITFYEVRYRLGKTTPWRTVLYISKDARSTTLNGIVGGRNYHVAVRAVTAEGGGVWSPLASIYVTGLASAPRKLELSQQPSTLDVSWLPPAHDGGLPVKRYELRLRPAGAPDWMRIKIGNRAMRRAADRATDSERLAYAIDGLLGGQKYQVQVRAVNAAGKGEWGRLRRIKVAAPVLAISDFDVFGVAEKIEVRWMPPANIGSTKVTGYELEYQSAASTIWSLAATLPASARAHTLKESPTGGPLFQGQDFRVRLRALTQYGGGAWTDVATAASIDIPNATNFAVATPLEAKFLLAWYRHAKDAKAAITGYEMEYRKTGDTAWTFLVLTSPHFSVTPAGGGGIFSGLANGQSYDMRVRAVNRVGHGPWSMIRTAQTFGVPSRPAKPAIVVNDGDVTVSWNAPANGGGALESYTLQYRAGNTPTWTQVSALTTTAHTITDLAINHTYHLRVRARNRFGDGAWSPTAAANLFAQPTAPVLQAVITKGDNALNIIHTAATANAGASLIVYDLQYRPQGTSDWYVKENFRGGGTVSSVDNLAGGVVYELRLRARIGAAASAWSGILNGTPKGGAGDLTGVSLTPEHNGATLAWSIHRDDRDAWIQNYDIEYRARGESEWNKTASFDGTAREFSLSFSGSNGVQTYEARVRAYSTRAGYSNWSRVVAAEVVSVSPTGEPGAPAAPRLTFNARVIYAHWAPPADIGGGAIQSYHVRLREVGATAWEIEQRNLNPLARRISFTSLLVRRQYEVQVRASNAFGNGAWSPLAVAKTEYCSQSECAAASESVAGRISRAESEQLAAAARDDANAQIARASAEQIARGQAAQAADKIASRAQSSAPRANLMLDGRALSPLAKPAARKLESGTDLATLDTESQNARHLSVQDLLARGSFHLSFSQEAGTLALWADGSANGDVRGFSSHDSASLTGTAHTSWVGMDYRSRALFGGLAVAQDQSRVAFSGAPAQHGSAAGTLATSLVGVYPHLRWSASERLDVWTMLGFGWGTLEFASDDNVAPARAAAQMQFYAAGGELQLGALYGVQFQAKADAAFTRLQVEATDGLAAVDVAPAHVRVALESEKAFAFGGGRVLTPRLELASRYDVNSVSANGGGLELGGELVYAHGDSRLEMRTSARGLLAHQNNLGDWGASFQVSLTPDTFGRGLSASFRPSWNTTASGADKIWDGGEQAALTEAATQSAIPSQLQLELGYGLRADYGGVWTPFLQYDFAVETNRVGLGARLALSDWLGLEILGEQIRSSSSSSAASDDYRLGLQLRLR